jgi:hypothetical protein
MLAGMRLEDVLSEDGGTRLQLLQRFRRVRVSAEELWRRQRLDWFTDHTAERHSRRIVDLLGALTERLQQTDQRLRPTEAYVLLAAVYLHDIGMQDFRVDGRATEDFTAADYKLIRTRHPQRGHDLIIERALQLEPGRDHFRIDLDDDLQYLLPIALVAKGHGSAFFETVVAELEHRDFAPDNSLLRGGLLTALLLIADELDLHEDRATFPPEMTLSPMSALHHHVNHYVTRVVVAAGPLPQQRSMQLSLAYPHGSEHYQPEVRSFIVDKLACQARRVNPVLRKGTRGEMELDTVIKVRETTEAIPSARRGMPEAALALLQSELWEQRLVGRGDLIAELKHWIAAHQPIQMELVADADGDLAALLRWLQAYAELSKVEWVHVDLGIGVATEPADLWERIRRETTSDPPASGFPATPPVFAEALGGERYVICVIEGTDRLEAESRTWLREELMRLAEIQHPALVIASHAPQDEAALRLTEVRRLDNLDADAIATHLNREFGYPPEQAAIEANDMFTLSNGAPQQVLAGLAARRNRQYCEATGGGT